MESQRTDHAVHDPDWFQRLGAYYQQYFERRGQGTAFKEWLDGIRRDLAEAAPYGADPAFILHVLVCTRWRRARRHAAEVKAIRRLDRRSRALLVGAFRRLRKLGEPWLAELLGPPGSERAKRFLNEVGLLEFLLTGGEVETPAWRGATHGRLQPRPQAQAVTACMVCLLSELEGHPKPHAAVAVLLEKSGLLKGSRRGAAGVAFVAKRAARAKTAVRDVLGPIGNTVYHLRSTFAHLKEWLLRAPDLPL